MRRPVQPIPCSVTMAARSTIVSWSMQPVGRPNTDRDGEGSGGGEGGNGGKDSSRCAAWWQALHWLPCLERVGFHVLQTGQRNCADSSKPGEARAVCGQEQEYVREQPQAHTASWWERVGLQHSPCQIGEHRQRQAAS